nr:7,8-didemethyl-8-hydroxy-5-deazariboflavin synthase subunit CofG [Candidatus Sigynarchaeum springense]
MEEIDSVSIKQLKAWYKEPLPELLRRADKERQEIFGQKVTFSRNYSIPLSNICRNNCAYCAFRARPPAIPAKILDPDAIQSALKHARDLHCWEVLFITGESVVPSEEIDNFLEGTQWTSIEEYYLWGLQEAVAMGLLPHSNFGPVTRDWLARFKSWNASMGLMLESMDPSLANPGMPHEFSPGKDPETRFRFIQWAGELCIPFTTGILIGIGETEISRLESLFAINTLSNRYHTIQEVIIQNFTPDPATPMSSVQPPPLVELLRLVAIARLTLEKHVSIQIPPNLNPKGILELVHAGANDLGGISPATIDYVNPRGAWPLVTNVSRLLAEEKIDLVPRLPVYDAFISEKFLSPAILRNITAIRKKIHDGS